MLSLLDKALQAILKMLKKKDERVLLWENASPGSTFKGQTINVDATQYGLIVLEERYSTETQSRETFIFTPVNGGYARELAGAEYSNVGYHSRWMEFKTSGITFGDNYYKNINTSTGGKVDNTYQIPQKIYGIKSSGGGKLVSLLRNIITKGGVRYA